MKFLLKIYEVFVHLMVLVDHNNLMDDYNLNVFVFVQDDKKHIEVQMMMHRFYHVLIYLKKNFFHILNTKIKKNKIY